MALTARQQEAVTVETPPRDTCIVAGPGSGKTTVLVEYFARLVEGGADPLRILAITFTEKAANNMRERLAERFRDRAGIRERLERAYVSTVHGFCARLLRENAIFAGIDPEFYVTDEREAARQQHLAAEEALDSLFNDQPERMRELMRGLAGVDTAGALCDVYEAIRAAGASIEDVAACAPPRVPDVDAVIEEFQRQRPPALRFDQLNRLIEVQEAAGRIREALADGARAGLEAICGFPTNLTKLPRNTRAHELAKLLKDELLPALEYALIGAYYRDARATLFAALNRFDALYRARKQQSGTLDFDDLEEYAVRLLRKNPDACRRVRSQFDHVLMDELQDTNGQQAKLLELLRTPDRFYAVGDINQSIYGFRHAEPGVFAAYRDKVAREGRRVVELEENFRSRAEILRVVEAVTRGAPGIVTRRLIAGLEFAPKNEPAVEVLAAADEEMEARLAAARIVEMHDAGHSFRDFAILVRNSEVLSAFTAALTDFGIPHLVQRGKGFYETREVIDLMALLRVIVNPRDEISMAVVLRSPLVGVPDEALLRLKLLGNLGAALESATAEQLAAFAPEDAARLERFRDQLAGWRALRDHLGIDGLLIRALDETGYVCPSGARGEANVEKLLAQARSAGTRQTLAQFVDEAGLARAFDPREAEAAFDDAADAVKVMTVHSAKGLEFPVVFLAAMNKGVDAGPGGIAFLPGIGLGARWRHPCGDGDKDDAFQHVIRERLKERDKEEANRLLYVAMTRAQDHLVLSLSTNARKPQNWAKTVQESLGLDLEMPRDEVVTVAAPSGDRAPVRVRSVDRAPERRETAARAEADAPVEWLDPANVTSRCDTHANVTAIALFAECPRRYYLSRYLGFEPPVQAGVARDELGAGLAAPELGKQVHTLLAGAVLESPEPEAAAMADVFRRSPLGKRAAAATSVEREFDFLMEVEDLVLRGQIDLWFEEHGKTVVVDYKTDRVTAAEATARADQYALQLRLYALALERLTGRAPAEAYVCFLRPNVTVRIDLRPSLFESPEAAVREFRDAQNTQSFPLREGEHCIRCPHFRGLCPAVYNASSTA